MACAFPGQRHGPQAGRGDAGAGPHDPGTRRQGATTCTVETDLTLPGKIGEFGRPTMTKRADALLKEFAVDIAGPHAA